MSQVIDTSWHPLADGNPPAWAVGWGQHRRYGVFVEFGIGDIVQRLRWIPPGQFIMGSPADEPGRYEREGPQHQVTIAEGFWLMDTPCTQELWQAVMGNNPSTFKHPKHPVEQVSWHDTQEFIARINSRIPGLDLSLPSEAQWEYACRADTTTALYTGPIEILGNNNAPALDPIAWYSGNSGVNFELDNGWNSADWSEKQYPHEKAGTHPIKKKRINPWGLYDMLGNVWEWCADDWHGSYENAPTDGTAWKASDNTTGETRVMRGGSWSDDARSVRAAYRDRNALGERNDDLGFRCSRVQS